MLVGGRAPQSLAPLPQLASFCKVRGLSSRRGAAFGDQVAEWPAGLQQPEPPGVSRAERTVFWRCLEFMYQNGTKRQMEPKTRTCVNPGSLILSHPVFPLRIESTSLLAEHECLSEGVAQTGRLVCLRDACMRHSGASYVGL